MSSSRKKVLWVDDEIEYLRSHIMFLETRGYIVTPVYSGNDAIGIVMQNPRGFDIVLLDEQMPGKDGLTTLEEIKEINPDLPVVMVTKSEEERTMDAALSKKIDGYLTKPVNPSQILLVCKNILESKQILSTQIKQKFIRNYSEMRMALANRPNVPEWPKLYEKLVKWDIELEKVEDEGLRQTHAGQKSDYNAVFSNFVIENYGKWIKGKNQPPILGHQIIEKSVIPNLVKDGKNILFVLSGMRLDQYVGIETVLKKFYSVKRQHFYSILPSEKTFSRSSFFAGALPVDIALQHPQYLEMCKDSNTTDSAFESKIFGEKLAASGLRMPENEPWFSIINHDSNLEKLLSTIDRCKKSPLVTLIVDFDELFTQGECSSNGISEIINGEDGFRDLTGSWFSRSILLQLFRELSKQDYTVFIISDHGNTFCNRATELYGAKDLNLKLRCKFGDEISTDERTALYLSDPAHFGIPSVKDGTSCIIAKDNYYFVQPDKLEFHQKQYRSYFQRGGISLEEVIMPLGIFSRLGE